MNLELARNFITCSINAVTQEMMKSRPKDIPIKLGANYSGKELIEAVEKHYPEQKLTEVQKSAFIEGFDRSSNVSLNEFFVAGLFLKIQFEESAKAPIPKIKVNAQTKKLADSFRVVRKRIRI